MSIPVRKYSKNNQSGGSKLGSGTYGCVVTPAIPCKGTKLKRTHKYVSKIVHVPNEEIENYKTELENYRILKKLDPKQRYTISILTECALDTHTALSRKPRDILDTLWNDEYGKDVVYRGEDAKIASRFSDEDLAKLYCNLDKTRKPRNIIQVRGGVPLSTVITNPDNPLFSLLKQNLHHVVKDLLTGLKIMHSGEFAHRDIKPNNIVIDEAERKKKKITKSYPTLKYPLCRYIDFGLSENVKALQPKNIMNANRQGTRGYMPIELNILDSIRDYIEERGIFVNLAAQNVKQHVVKETFARYQEEMGEKYKKLNINKKTIALDLYQYGPEINKEEYASLADMSMLYDKFIEQFRRGIFPEMYFKRISGYVYKSDVFALGIVFKLIVNVFNLENTLLDNLVRNMLQIDPDKRFSVLECLDHPYFKQQSPPTRQ